MSDKLFFKGCGVGNSVLPLLESVNDIYIYACDFSSTAIKLLQESSRYQSDRVTSFVCDASKEEIPLENSSIDYCILIFVLSAMSVDQIKTTISRIYKVLKPGGKLCIRDYAIGDLAQLRFEEVIPDKDPNKLDENFYVRGDGTRAYYFTTGL